MKNFVIAFDYALIFGVGLGVAGMTRPEKVIGFLDITGDWDPSLALVMVGAIAIHALSYRLIMRRQTPIFSTKFYLPTRRDLDFKLFAGALIFGIGWGLGGFCPGPAIVSAITGNHAVLAFLGSMIFGIYLQYGISRIGQKKETKQ